MGKKRKPQVGDLVQINEEGYNYLYGRDTLRNAELIWQIIHINKENGSNLYAVELCDEPGTTAVLVHDEFEVWYPYVVAGPDNLPPFGDEVDVVNHPPHYLGFSNGAEVIDITEHLDFCTGNAVKYLARAGKKNAEKEIEDLRKAEWYIKRRIAFLSVAHETNED